MQVDHPDRSYFYEEFPQTCSPDDFWGQVKRTVNGKPVGEDQIKMIVDAIIDCLEIKDADTLLDLCCGNGALTDRIFAHCRGGVGVDFSPALIKVAERYFQAAPERVYHLNDAESHLQKTDDTARFTKALCYGAFQYLSETKAQSALTALKRRFPQVDRIFIGNLPDKARMDRFYRGRAQPHGIEKDPQSPLGIWRSEDEFAALARGSGWETSFRQMPPEFYAAAYRYDAVLTPA